MDDYEIKNICDIQFDQKKLNQLASVLNYLSPNTNIDLEQFNDHIHTIKNTKHIYTLIIISKKNDTIIGTGSVIIEQKLLRNMAKVGHIEDIVIHKDHRGKKLAKILMNNLIDICKYECCYKIILDASDDIKILYEKMGFHKSANTMRYNII
jgi:glucosamine-phosphate N-acetyltransferase